MLYFIGLGLGDGRDISIRGLEVVKKCAFVYLESYTSILMITREELQEFYGREVIEMDREAVESGCEKMLHDALTKDVAFLVVGDAFRYGISFESFTIRSLLAYHHLSCPHFPPIFLPSSSLLSLC
jgi:diphthamide biosynthesis methyltransferase